MLSRFHLIQECHGQTDGQICYINIAHQRKGTELNSFVHTAVCRRAEDEKIHLLRCKRANNVSTKTCTNLQCV